MTATQPSNSITKYSLVVFDFDGTLADTLDVAFKIYNQLADARGLRKIRHEELGELRNYSVKELLKHLSIPKTQMPRLLAEGVKMLRSQVSSMPLTAGAQEIIERFGAREMMLGILTSNSVENVEAFLQAKGLEEAFEFVSSTSRLSGKSKYLKSILRTFSKTPDQVLYIGDEIRDIRASQKAGIDVAAVTWGFNSEKALRSSNPTYLFDRPSDLLSFIGGEADAR